MCVYSVAQSLLTLCDAMCCSLPGSSVHEIFQARILKWVATFFSRGSSRPRDQTHISCVSCIGRWILYHFTTWEEVWAPDGQSPLPQRSEVLLQAPYLNTYMTWANHNPSDSCGVSVCKIRPTSVLSTTYHYQELQMRLQAFHKLNTSPQLNSE